MVSPIIFYEEPCYGVSRAGSTLWKSSRSFQNNQGSVILRFLIVGKGFNRSKDFTYWIGRGQILFKAAVAKLRPSSSSDSVMPSVKRHTREPTGKSCSMTWKTDWERSPHAKYPWLA